jgi:hypothetical protein
MGAQNCTVQETKSSGIILLGDDGWWLGPTPAGVPGEFRLFGILR